MESFIFSIVKRETEATSIDSDPNSGTIFWLDSNRGTLNSVKRDGTEARKIFSDLHSPQRISVDWIAKNIYWTDDETDVIEMADFEGKYRYKVILLYDVKEVFLVRSKRVVSCFLCANSFYLYLQKTLFLTQCVYVLASSMPHSTLVHKVHL